MRVQEANDSYMRENLRLVDSIQAGIHVHQPLLRVVPYSSRFMVLAASRYEFHRAEDVLLGPLAK